MSTITPIRRLPARPAAIKPAAPPPPPQNPVKALFSKTGTVKIGTDRLKGGRYLAAIQSCVLDVAERSKKQFVRIRCVCAHAFEDAQGRTEGQPGYEGHRLGEEFTLAIFPGDYGDKEMTLFLAAAFSLPHDQCSPDMAATACGYDEAGNLTDTQPLYGVALEVKGELRAGKPDDKGIVKIHTNQRFVRAYSEAEVMELVGEENYAVLFPDGVTDYASVAAA